jgi:hypothetical protein
LKKERVRNVKNERSGAFQNWQKIKQLKVAKKYKRNETLRIKWTIV